MGLTGVLTLTGAPALGQESSRTVIATMENEFFPSTLTVPPSTTINWENRGVLHNVKFDDGSFEQPADPQATPWRVSRHFDDPGVFRYYCENHGGPNGQGMSGTIRVEASAVPTLTGLKIRPKRVCRRRTRKCRKAYGVVTFNLSEAARVAGAIDPVGKPAGRLGKDIQFAGVQGRNKFRIKGRSLRRGRYKLTIAAEDADGNETNPVSSFFRVKKVRRKRSR